MNLLIKASLEIVDYGFTSIKHFRSHSDLCLAGEDKSFIRNLLIIKVKQFLNQLKLRNIFPKDDFVKK